MKLNLESRMDNIFLIIFDYFFYKQTASKFFLFLKDQT